MGLPYLGSGIHSTPPCPYNPESHPAPSKSQPTFLSYFKEIKVTGMVGTGSHMKRKPDTWKGEGSLSLKHSPEGEGGPDP